MTTNKYTSNNDPTLRAVSNTDGETPVYLYADPTTHGLVVSATISSVGLATSTIQTDGTQKTQIVGPTGTAVTVTGGKLDVNATASLAGTVLPIAAATTAVGVAIVDGSGNQVTSFGGGTQYAEGTTTTPATGTVALARYQATPATITDGKLTTPLTDANSKLIVVTSGTTTVSGTVTANAGTNLNTSLLALESGGNLATIAGKDFATQTTLASLNAKVTAVNTGAVVVSSSALPTGASTSAKQPALGAAGTASADVITVQGIASMTALKVDGSAVTQPVSLATNTPTLQSGSTTAVTQATAANLNATVVGTGTFVTQSTLAAETTKVIGVTRTADGSGNLLTSTTNALDVNLKTSSITLPVSLASTTITGTVAVTESGTWNVGSSTATGSAVPANGFYGSGIAKTSLPTAASDGNLTGEMTDKFGRQVILNNAIRDIVGSQTTTISASTAETTIITAAASIFNDLSAIFISNTSATAARVDIRDTTGGSVIFQLYIPAGDVRGISLNTPWPQTTVNTNWTAQSSASVTDLRVSAMFVKNK